MNGAAPLLVVHGLSVRFERWGQTVQALRGIELSIERGEWIALVGHNGSGKSSLLRAVAGLTRLDEGDIRLGGLMLRKLSASQRAKRMFLVHQDPLRGTAPLLTLAENLRVAGSTRADALATLSSIGLAERANQPVNLLSGGERQLLALAIATCRSPELLLLDEPFSALDPDKEKLALELLDELRRGGTTVLQITHQLSSLEGKATRIVRLSEGRLVSDGPMPTEALPALEGTPA